MKVRSLLLAAVAIPLVILLLIVVIVAGVGGSQEEDPSEDDAGPAAPVAAGQSVDAAAGFDAGNIISDAVFYNTRSMSVDQIREFITTQGAGCAGTWCLKNLPITAPATSADKYCNAWGGATERDDAATVIAGVSQACGINPQVMLTTLQKESQLVSRTDPTEHSWDAAWGWYCPDTGPGGSANCDPAHAGFVNQLYGMAKQWSRYRVDAAKYNLHAGQSTDIMWNVAETGCGAGKVSIANQATASLYNYTPYQPNAASLAAYPGEGDRCSSYGNRNFYYMFVRYFGATGGGTASAADPAAGPVTANGTTITLPDHPNVAAAVRGKTITAPTAGVAKGLIAGMRYLGYPYVWGGGGDGAGPDDGCARGGGAKNSCQGLSGFDCSGLTGYVLVQGGYPSPGGNSGAQRGAGQSVPYNLGQAGDIVGFPGHVAIYLGTIDGTPYILQASTVGVPIQIVPLKRSDRDSVLHRYWSSA